MKTTKLKPIVLTLALLLSMMIIDMTGVRPTPQAFGSQGGEKDIDTSEWNDRDWYDNLCYSFYVACQDHCLYNYARKILSLDSDISENSEFYECMDACDEDFDECWDPSDEVIDVDK